MCDYKVSSIKTLMQLSKCYSRSKDYANSHKAIDELIMSVSEQLGSESAESAMAYIEKAKIYGMEDNHHEA